jgi:cytochrome c oxidase subunit 1
MHGTIMVFLAVVPMIVGALGNYLVPLQIGAPDMAFPRLNMLSYQAYFCGGIVMLVSFFIPGGAAQSGWTSYAPLAVVVPTMGQTFWLIGMVLLITSSLLGSINILVTIIQLRAPGLTWWRLPFFIWAQLVTSFLLLLAFPPLEAAGIMQLMDKVFGSSFFLPTGLVVGGQPLDISGGGSPLLYQHLFWFLAHPEVYVLILPAMGVLAEVISCNTRKAVWGYRLLVYSSLALGFLSMLVWAHHMYLTGMGTRLSTFFQTTTMLWGGSIRFNSAMLFCLAFLPMFGIGGLTGLPLGFSFSDIHLHDSYYVIGHFHYVVAPGTIFAIFGAVYHWYPKVTGRHLNEFWGRVHFVFSLIFMNLIFFPMFLQGIYGMSRRMSDGGATYAQAPDSGVVGLPQWAVDLNINITQAAFGLLLGQIPFIINFFWSLKHGKKASDNPWEATTLEWQTPTPPGHGNFTRPIRVYRGPYEYSLPGRSQDFTPQTEPDPPKP